MCLAAEGGRYPAILNRHGCPTLVVQYLNVFCLWRKKILVISCSKGPALFDLEQRAFPAAFTAAPYAEGDSGGRHHMAVHRRQGIRYILPVSKAIAAVMVLPAYDISGDAVSIPACFSRAAFSKGGKALPRRSARFKIPAQALGDKEYFSGAFTSKI